MGGVCCGVRGSGPCRYWGTWGGVLPCSGVPGGGRGGVPIDAGVPGGRSSRLGASGRSLWVSAYGGAGRSSPTSSSFGGCRCTYWGPGGSALGSRGGFCHCGIFLGAVRVGRGMRDPPHSAAPRRVRGNVGSGGRGGAERPSRAAPRSSGGAVSRLSAARPPLPPAGTPGRGRSETLPPPPAPPPPRPRTSRAGNADAASEPTVARRPPRCRRPRAAMGAARAWALLRALRGCGAVRPFKGR